MNLMKFLKDEEGQSMVEYGITLGGVAAVSYIAIVMMGDRVADLYAWMANHLPGGEADDNGQARVDSDGLVGLNEDVGFNEQIGFAARNEPDYTMINTLGSNSAYDDVEAWGTPGDPTP
ncbi:MAG: Flp family type IVb pilin [Burkholderiales bacterium]|nr:Flp family type IVb pilin [Burkholderiales bacterium]